MYIGLLRKKKVNDMYEVSSTGNKKPPRKKDTSKKKYK